MLTVLISDPPRPVQRDVEVNRTWKVSLFRFLSGNVHDPQNQEKLKLFSRFSWFSFSFVAHHEFLGTSGQESFNQMWKFCVTRV